MFHYEAANPGQDFNQLEAAAGPGLWNETDRPSHGLLDAGGSSPQHAPGGQPNHHPTDEAKIDNEGGPVDTVRNTVSSKCKFSG